MNTIKPLTDAETDAIRSRLSYDPASGVLIHKVAKNSRGGVVKAGDPIHCNCLTRGYMRTIVQKRGYYVHRLAWFLHHGVWTDREVDHIDHDRTNNRISNLRLVEQADNKRNASMNSRNTSGFNGVSWNKIRKKWRASFKSKGKSTTIGHFDKLEDAVAARQAANECVGFHENHGI